MAVNDPLLGRQLGDYIIQSVLGQGGMARVYRGYDSKLDRYAAVKVIEPKLIGAEEEDDYRERFLREARSIARLNHPRIVGIYQFGSIDTFYYMAMSFLEGRDLRQILKEYARQDKKLAHQQIMSIIRDIADALDYAHRQGVIHRDVKPSNIMVTSDGHAVLTDFGLALNAQEGTIGNTFGSVHYIAPEQAVSSKDAKPQSDLYALGVILYEILVGQVPFEDVSAMSVALKHISDPPPLPRSINPTITPQIEQVILKTMEKEPERRYPNGAAFTKALEMAFAAAADDEDTSELEASESRKPVIADPYASQEILMPTDTPSRLRKQDETPTLTDSSPLPHATLPFSPLDDERHKKKSRRWMGLLAGVIVGFIILAALALVIAPSIFGGDDENAHNTATAAAVLNIEATVTQAFLDGANTATAAALAAITDEPTETPSPTPSSTTEPPLTTPTYTPMPPTETEIPATATATSTPTVDASPTPAGTPLLELTPAPNAPEMILRYNGQSLVVFHRGAVNQGIDVSQITFVRGSVRFAADEWPQQNVLNLSGGNCFQVWSEAFMGNSNLNALPIDLFPSDVCNARRGSFATSREFWVSDDPQATFEVRLSNIIIGVCPTIPGDNREGVYCEVDLPN